jgi:hypothetical protein
MAASMNESRSSYQIGFVICLLCLTLDVWFLASRATQDRVAAWVTLFVFALFATAFALPAFGRPQKRHFMTTRLRRPGAFPRVVLFYGVKIVTPAKKKKLIEKIEADRLAGLRQAGVETISGYSGKTYFCYAGRKLGTIGLDFAGHIHYGIDSLAEISADVRTRLKESGTTGTPSLHLWQS